MFVQMTLHIAEVYVGQSQTPAMELSAKIDAGFQLLSLFGKKPRHIFNWFLYEIQHWAEMG